MVVINVHYVASAITDWGLRRYGVKALSHITDTSSEVPGELPVFTVDNRLWELIATAPVLRYPRRLVALYAELVQILGGMPMPHPPMPSETVALARNMLAILEPQAHDPLVLTERHESRGDFYLEAAAFPPGARERIMASVPTPGELPDTGGSRWLLEFLTNRWFTEGIDTGWWAPVCIPDTGLPLSADDLRTAAVVTFSGWNIAGGDELQPLVNRLGAALRLPVDDAVTVHSQ